MAKNVSKNSSELAITDERFARTSALPGVTEASLGAIAAARVLVIGAGGLGSPVLQYLAACGIGTIGIVDFDVVDLSNLQRQVIHGAAAIGMSKTASAASAIAALNPEVRVVQHQVRLDRGNALQLFEGYDIIVDASDNFATRYLSSDSAALLRRPYVWGSVLRFDGQLSVFWEGAPVGPSLDYRDLHPVAPDPAAVLSCAEAGVLGSLCGTIGTMMATEVFKLVAGVGTPMVGRVQNLDALTGTWREFELQRSPDRIPVTGLMDYEEFCGLTRSIEPGMRGSSESSGSSEGTGATEREVVVIEIAELARTLAAGARLVDVREPWEHEAGHIGGDVLIPFATLVANPALAGAGPVILYCATGARSSRAARVVMDAGIDAVTLRGGYQAWRFR